MRGNRAIGLEETMQISEVTQVAETVLTRIRDATIAPHQKKELHRRFNRQELADLVGRTRSYLAKIEKELVEEKVLSPIEDKGPTRFEVKHVRELQQHFGTTPWRDPDLDEALVLAVSSLKGGVAKTTLTTYTAQHLASKGYRVLIVDMDNQASATATFGIIPDLEVSESQTVLGFFEGSQETLDYAIQETYWPGLDLIPTNLTAFNIEWSLAAELMKGGESTRDELLNLLRDGIETVKDNYDVVIIDCPPNLGTTSMNIFRAADALLIPTPAKLLDFSSTVQYLRMVDQYSEELGLSDGYKFIKMATTLYEGRFYNNQPNQQMKIRGIMKKIFGDMLLNAPFYKTNEIENAAASMTTVLEDRRPQKKALEMISRFCREVEAEILHTWPSKQKEAFDMKKALKEEAADMEDVA
jgi:chromosome partitioning protein